MLDNLVIGVETAYGNARSQKQSSGKCGRIAFTNTCSCATSLWLRMIVGMWQKTQQT